MPDEATVDSTKSETRKAGRKSAPVLRKAGKPVVKPNRMAVVTTLNDLKRARALLVEAGSNLASIKPKVFVDLEAEIKRVQKLMPLGGK